jgi:hypothetical protein
MVYGKMYVNNLKYKGCVMKIKRRGSGADHSPNYVNFEKTTVKWDENEKSVVLSSRRVKDFNIKSYHNYEVFLPLEELAKVLIAVGEQGIPSSTNKIEQDLATALKALVRITVAVSGLAQQEISKPNPTLK